MKMRNYSTISISKTETLSLDQFKEMDYYAVENYNLPIELMMENAGLQLARLVSSFSDFHDSILIGIGNGNNGGGGLVAARRLAAWGYDVYLDIPSPITKELPKLQLERALKFGVKKEQIANPKIWVDAYLGFSQRLPLNNELAERVEKANTANCIKISLDLPTGFLGDSTKPYFKASHVLSLAALKDILVHLPKSTELYLADLGLPKAIYKKFGTAFPPFERGGVLQVDK